MELKVIARIRTDFKEKFGLPRQSGYVPELVGTVIFEKEYRSPDALREIEGYSHLWLIWGFSEKFASGNESSAFSPTVRPPRLGGNKRVGVFASRSPNRPNPLALSAVHLESVEETEEYGTVLRVSGIDMTDNTPIYDIKPYLPHSDSISDAIGGFADEVYGHKLKVTADESTLMLIPEPKRKALLGVLSEDPRPSYQNDPTREYFLDFAGFTVTFSVDGDKLYVKEIK